MSGAPPAPRQRRRLIWRIGEVRLAGVAGQLLAHMLAVRMADTAQRMLQPSLMPMPQRLPGLKCQAGVRHSHGPRDGQGPCAGVDLPGSGHFVWQLAGLAGWVGFGAGLTGARQRFSFSAGPPPLRFALCIPSPTASGPLLPKF